jgi:hypothetical protein
MALLSKWLYRLLTTDGTWQEILRNKYLGTKPLVQVQWKKRGLTLLGWAYEG